MTKVYHLKTDYCYQCPLHAESGGLAGEATFCNHNKRYKFVSPDVKILDDCPLDDA